MKPTELDLLKPWMQLNLIDRRCDTRFRHDPRQMGRLKVGDTDRFRKPLLPKLDQGPPGLDILVVGRDRPVNQIQIDVVRPESVQASVEWRAVALSNPW